MTQDELKLVLNALKWCHGGEPCGTAEAIAVIEKALANVATNDTSKEYVDEMQKQRHEQEPVAWMKRINMPGDDWDAYDFSVNQYGDFQTPLYTTPPQHTWVGLTDEEIDLIDEATWDEDHKSWGIHDFARAVEAKLKEKNSA